MRHILMIGLALLLGVLAFAFNAAYLSSRTTPKHYVIIEQPVAAGEICQKESFKSVAIQADIQTAAVPYDDVATLWGRTAVRNLEPGELVLWQDVVSERASIALQPAETGLYIPVDELKLEPGLLQVGAKIGFVVPRDLTAAASKGGDLNAQVFEQLGPFRIVSINSKVEESPFSDSEDNPGSRVATITVAVRIVDGNFEPQCNRLIDASNRNLIHAVTLNGQPVSKIAGNQP